MLFLNRRPEQQGPELSQGIEGALAWAGDTYRSSAMNTAQSVVTKRMCGSPECSGSRLSPWRNRKRPIFEGEWACSGRCVLGLVSAAIRREANDMGDTLPIQHRHRVPLGLVLLSQGWITQAQLQQALSAQRQQGGRIGERLIADCGVEATQIMRGLSMQWGCPVLSTKGFTPSAMALVMPKLFIEEFGLLPLRVAGSHILYLGFEDHLDASAALALEQMTELKVESGLVPAEDYFTARQNLLEYEGVSAKMMGVDEQDVLAAKITAILEQKQPVASRLVRMHKYYWLRLWLENGAKRSQGALPHNREDMMDYVFTIGRSF